jgi:hypothetical protein
MTIIQEMSIGAGRFGKFNATSEAPKAPMQSCPSWPMFQNFIRKAIALPSERMVNGMAVFTVSLKRENVAVEPVIKVQNTLKGF